MATSEALYSFTTKINGDLFTVRGDTFDQFHTNLAEAVTNMQALIEDIGLLQAAGHAAPLVTNTPAAPFTPPVQAASDPFAAALAPSCAHGPRNPVAKVGANGPYRAWFCGSTNRNEPNKCKPIFVKEGTPEWNNFPAQ